MAFRRTDSNGWLFSLASALMLLFLAGCVTNGAFPVPSDLTIHKYADPSAPPGSPRSMICQEIEGDNPCYCMICENGPFYCNLDLSWSWPSEWFDATLCGGSCGIAPCNANSFKSTYNQSLDQDNAKQPRTFMYGAGPSFFSAGHANLFCNHSLQIAPKWMVGTDSPPAVPDAKRAVCWLDRNILPLYMYYTGGENIDASRTHEIANELYDGGRIIGQNGPVIFATEVGLNSSNATQVAQVKQQIDAVKASCPTCIVVLSVKSGDKEALQQFLGDPGAYNASGPPPSPYWGKIDLVGFGFRANDYGPCTPDFAIGQNYFFSRYVLEQHSKPTIWLYAGASEGNNSDGSCAFSREGVAQFYESIFTWPHAFASAGIVGVNFYEFLDGTGPISCNGIQGCNFGMIDASGNQKHPSLNTWSELCGEYATLRFRPPLIFSRNGNGLSCSWVQQERNMASIVAGRYNSNIGFSDAPVEPAAFVQNLSCGELCVSDEDFPGGAAYGGIGISFDSSLCPFANPAKFPQIDERAESAEISPLYMRAIIRVESNFIPSAASCVNESNMACNPLNLTMQEICTKPDGTVLPGCDPSFACATAGFKPCSFGLAQCNNYPGFHYATVPPELRGCGGADYNPFDPGHSVCCGVKKYSDYLSRARNFINGNFAILSSCDGGMEEEEKEWAAYSLASAYYNMGPGHPNLTMGNFLSQRDSGGECSGIQHYIAYIKSFNDYSAKVMSTYKRATDVCQTDCSA